PLHHADAVNDLLKPLLKLIRAIARVAWGFRRPLQYCIETKVSLSEMPETGRNDIMIEVTLLGTGSPIPDARRAGPSTLVRAGSQTFLIDCGRGVQQRVTAAGVGADG